MDKKHLYLGLSIAGLALFLTFRNVSWGELASSLRAIEYIYLLPAIILCALTFVIRALRWSILVGSLKETSTKRLMSPLCIGFMGNLLPARAGEFIRAYLLGKKEGLTFSASFATIFVERVFDMFTLLAMTVWLLIFKADIFKGIDGFGGYSMIELLEKFGWLSLTIGLFILFFSFALIHWNEKMMGLIRILLRPLPEKVADKIMGLTDSFASGLNILKDSKSVVQVTGLSILTWMLIALSYYPFYFAYRFDQLPFSSLIVLMVTICAFITICPTPGFLGSFQLGCVVALHNIFQVTEAEAASFGMVSWMVQFGTLALMGGYYIIKDGISFKQLAHIQEEADA